MRHFIIGVVVIVVVVVAVVVAAAVGCDIGVLLFSLFYSNVILTESMCLVFL